MKIVAQIEDITLTMEATEGGWVAESVTSEGKDTKTLSSQQAGATLALFVGMDENPGLEVALYEAIGSTWDGSPARPIP